MSIEARIDTLKARHAQLEDALHDEEVRPSPDETRLLELKRRKLALKDEMSRLASA